jgi:F0F1-type ATP synthase membrane subunit a
MNYVRGFSQYLQRNAKAVPGDTFTYFHFPLIFSIGLNHVSKSVLLSLKKLFGNINANWGGRRYSQTDILE